MSKPAEQLVVRSSVHVPLEQEEAFRLFTDRMGEWWPLQSHSVFGTDATGVSVEPRAKGRILEQSTDSQSAEWGRITVWEPPRAVSFTWYPGRDDSEATLVELTFSSGEGGGTRVDLVHTGWEIRGDRAAEAAASYGPGWELVLGRYAGAADRAA